MSRQIDSAHFVAEVPTGQAELWLRLVESGKTLPFRVTVTHKGPTTNPQQGTLAALETEDDAREQFDFHVEQAQAKGWQRAPSGRVKLWPGVPAPGDDATTRPLVPVPVPKKKRGPGRPRRSA